MMRRTAIAAAWLLGTTIPLLIAVGFVFGCCVLPFHGVIHKVIPLCDVAIGLMHVPHHDQQPLPARARQEPVKRIVSSMPRSFPLAVTSSTAQGIRATNAGSYRSFIALGAIRCDQDIGLHLLLAALLI